MSHASLRTGKCLGLSRASSLLLRVFFLVLAALVAGWPGPVWGEPGEAAVRAGGARLGAANPAALYCRRLGYAYKVVRTEAGEQGLCVVAPGVEFDAWDFFKGKVGQEHSYAARHGYDVRTERVDHGSYIEEYAVCIARGPGKEEIPLLELMARNGEPLTACGSCGYEPGAGITGPWPQPPGAGLPKQDAGRSGAVGAAPSFDWRDYNGADWITVVKDQGMCGSCWAFSVVGVVEAKLNIDNSHPDLDYDLSEQQLVSCDCPGDCNGGWIDAALDYLIDTGVTDEACFPYLGCKDFDQDTGLCVEEWPCDLCPEWESTAIRIAGYDNLNPTAAAYKQALLDYGPLSIAIDASEWSSYAGGVLVTDPLLPNHAVVLVGYNDTGEYWIIKNSWGTEYGHKGYYYVPFGVLESHRRIYAITGTAITATVAPEPGWPAGLFAATLLVLLRRRHG